MRVCNACCIVFATFFALAPFDFRQSWFTLGHRRGSLHLLLCGRGSPMCELTSRITSITWGQLKTWGYEFAQADETRWNPYGQRAPSHDQQRLWMQIEMKFILRSVSMTLMHGKQACSRRRPQTRCADDLQTVCAVHRRCTTPEKSQVSNRRTSTPNHRYVRAFRATISRAKYVSKLYLTSTSIRELPSTIIGSQLCRFFSEYLYALR